jgi:hypothetical protein
VDTTAQIVNDLSLIEPFAEAMVGEGGYRSVLGFFTYAGATPAVAPSLREQLARVRAVSGPALRTGAAGRAMC